MEKLLTNLFLVKIALCVMLMTACKAKDKNEEEIRTIASVRSGMVDKQATDETVALFDNLMKLSEDHILFGHQAATEYGRGWYGDENRSDVKDATGSHPAVIGHDFMDFTGNQSEEEIQKEKERLAGLIAATYDRGGVITIAWHFPNPVEGNSFYWEQSPVRAVEKIIPGGSHHEKYKEILGRVADFANTTKGKDGKPVPMIFRPYHEFDGDWFWWGRSHSTTGDFVALWKFTVAYLRDSLDVHNFIYAFSPDCRFNTETEFLERYPGDEWVDMVGVDNYADFGRDASGSLEAGIKKLKIVSDYAQAHNKLAAFTETGLESIPDTTWWTNTLLHAVKDSGVKLSYVLVWRNDSRSPTHYYATPKGHPSHDNFMEFYNDPFTLFETDLTNIYTFIPLSFIYKNHIVFLSSFLFLLLFPLNSLAQTEVMAWGNMTGIRIEGELIEFESSLRIADPDWKHLRATGKERQRRPQYNRRGDTQIVKTVMDNIRFEQTVEDRSAGNVSVSLTMVSDTALKTGGVYYCMEFSQKRYANASVQVGNNSIQFAQLNDKGKTSGKYTGKKIIIDAPGRNITLDFTASVTAFIRKEDNNTTALYVQMAGPNIRKKQNAKLNFTIAASGHIDNEPVEIMVDRHSPGRLFDGLGGNFRLQNPRVDPQVIDYCLQNLRVSWGRVEMPWRLWHPEEDMDPIAEARAGRLNERVDAAMKMAQRLAAMGMPVIVSCWFPPVWAIDGDPSQYVRRGGVQAFRLDPAKQQKIYKSLTDYLVYLKQEYGVEAIMYSFNESDLGIDVLHTAQEHADFIKGMGAYMASQGLATTMLLGDNSDATTFDFILPAMHDPEAHKYIGAVSFHSWRGCDDETLQRWGNATRILNVPLLIGEGSTDAAAHVYPEIFAESTFALYEINLYTRICAISQPLSILQWQLTSDYSILWGDGVYGSEGPLRPTQRFWNLRQLADTPAGSFALPFTCNKEEVNSAAFGNIARGEYTVHMVNNGAARKAVLKGLPASLKEIEIYVTNHSKGREKVTQYTLNDGVIEVDLPPISFVSVYGK